MEATDTTSSESALTEELKILARAKSVSEYRNADLPEMRRIAAAQQSSSTSETDLRVLIELAIDRVPDEQYRDAVHAIFGFTSNRWSSLKDRQSDAARAFGVGFDAFRRRRSSSGQSMYDECIQEMARSLELTNSVEPAETVDTVEPTEPAAGRPADPRPRKRRRSLGLGLVAGLAVGLLLGLIGGQLTTEPAMSETGQPSGEVDVDGYCRTAYSDESVGLLVTSTASGWRCHSPGRTEGEMVDFTQACALQYGTNTRAQLRDYSDPLSWSCAFEGDLDERSADECLFDPGFYMASEDEDLGAYAQGFFKAYDQAGGEDLLGCPATPLYRRGLGVSQDLATAGVITGALLALTPDQDVVVLRGAAWETYRRFGGGFGLSSALIGYPLDEPAEIDGIWQVRGSNNGLLVASQQDGPYYVIPQVSRDVWLDEGGPTGALGMPISDLYGTEDGVRQDFENGYMLLAADGLVVRASEG